MKLRWHSSFMSALVLFFVMVQTSELNAHARWSAGKSLKARTNDDGNKSGPCGGKPQLPDNERVQLTAGDDLLVEWEETIEHPGWYRIAFSTDGTNGYDDNVIADNIPDTTGSVTRSDPATWHRYSKTIKVPDTTCDKCSLQLIQAMTENPMNPSYYYSCADVRIVAPGTVADKPAVPVLKTVTVTKEDKGVTQ